MDRLKFVFKVKAALDGKSNIAITSIIDEEDRIFLFPEELQAATIHQEIKDSKTYSSIKNTKNEAPNQKCLD